MGEIHLEFFLFTTDLDLALKAQHAKIDSIVVDWESKAKIQRQKGYNLEINSDTPQDVKTLSSNLKIPVTVRINSLTKDTKSEVDLALKNGSKILMLPMAKSVSEVEAFLKAVDDRCRTIVQIETPSLVEEIEGLKTLDWDYAYIGLNDLMVASGKRSIWQAIADGTAERICKALNGRVYGFGGSTILGGGEPILNVLIVHELIRLGGSVSVMRRTFKQELLDRNLDLEMQTLRNFIDCSRRRGKAAKDFDHKHLLRIIELSVSGEESPKRTENSQFSQIPTRPRL